MERISSLLATKWVQLAIVVVVTALLFVAPLVLPVRVNQTLIAIGVYAVAVLGLNIIMGYTGQVNLGQIFFLGLGAYVAAYGVNPVAVSEEDKRRAHGIDEKIPVASLARGQEFFDKLVLELAGKRK